MTSPPPNGGDPGPLFARPTPPAPMKPQGETSPAYDVLTLGALALTISSALELAGKLPNSRGVSLVRTKLEEAELWLGAIVKAMK